MEHPRRYSNNPTIAVLLEHGIEPTLDGWLDFNGVSDVYDAELLEIIPPEFCNEYNARLRLNLHYETKFAEHTAMKRAGVPKLDHSLCNNKNDL